MAVKGWAYLEVTLLQAQLVLGWVTSFGWANHLGL